jgi:hypothetical protein
MTRIVDPVKIELKNKLKRDERINTQGRAARMPSNHIGPPKKYQIPDDVIAADNKALSRFLVFISLNISSDF